MTKIQTTARCFRRSVAGDDGRPGIWVMTGPARGAFFHGDRKEVQAPCRSVDELATGRLYPAPTPGIVQEVSPEDVLDLLANWPEAQEDARQIFARHPLKGEPKDEPS